MGRAFARPIYVRRGVCVDGEQVKPRFKSFTNFLRFVFKGFLDTVGGFLIKIGLTPMAITIIGVIGNFISAFFIANGQIWVGGLIMLIMTPFDALDGTMARLKGESSEWGAFVDSVSDRYSELAILGGLVYYFATQGNVSATVATFAAAAGSVLVSYTKARASSLNFDADTGLLTRVERYLILAPLLVFNQPAAAVWIIAVLSNITALQRIWRVRRQAHGRYLFK